MLRLRQNIEDQLDRGVELPGHDNVELVRKLDDG
jgi:hypothetical protein